MESGALTTRIQTLLRQHYRATLINMWGDRGLELRCIFAGSSGRVRCKNLFYDMIFFRLYVRLPD
jgi:hypothetical protein